MQHQQPPIDLANQDRYRQQFFKTSMCKYFLENACRKGATCSHAHSPEELTCKPVLSKTRMCKQILRNGNCTDTACTFAHEIDELIQANAFFRTKMCEFHLSGNGCKLGDKCRYAHSSTQLSDMSAPVRAPAPVAQAPAVDFNDSPDTGYPMHKRGSMGSKSTIASASYASLGSFSPYQAMANPSMMDQGVAAVPVVFVYPTGSVAYAAAPIYYNQHQPYHD